MASIWGWWLTRKWESATTSASSRVKWDTNSAGRSQPISSHISPRSWSAWAWINSCRTGFRAGRFSPLRWYVEVASSTCSWWNNPMRQPSAAPGGHAVCHTYDISKDYQFCSLESRTVNFLSIYLFTFHISLMLVVSNQKLSTHANATPTRRLLFSSQRISSPSTLILHLWGRVTWAQEFTVTCVTIVTL